MDREDVFIRLSTRTGVVMLMLHALAGTTVGAQQMDCSQIENARDRIACFDRFFPRDPSRPSVAPVPAEPTSSPAPAYSKPDEVTTAPTKVGAADVPITEEDDQQFNKTTRQSQDPAIPKTAEANAEDDFGLEQAERVRPTKPRPVSEIQSSVKALRRKDRQEVIFLLDNGQIWIQDVFRHMTVKKGDAVTIKRARLGGYILTTDRGASTRVLRIK